METKIIEQIEFNRNIEINKFWGIKEYPEGVILNLTVTDLNTDVELTTTILLQNKDVGNMLGITVGIYNLDIRISKLGKSSNIKGDGYDIIFLLKKKIPKLTEFLQINIDDDWLVDYVYDLLEAELELANEEELKEAKLIKETEEMLNKQFRSF